MASGLAVAGFDYAAARIFVKDGESGLTAPCGIPEGLVAAGVRLATDPALRSRLKFAGRAAVEAQSWETVISRFERNLEEAAGVAHTHSTAAPVLA
jgi:glycosyltransferase involved in cell wall biosynthesis